MTEDESGSGRDRGILTTADRDYLMNSEEYSRQAAHARQKSIRKRTQDAIKDFEILYEYLSDDQRERILTPRQDEGEFQEAVLLDRGFMSAIAWVIEQKGKDRFEEILERAITHVLADERRPGWVDPAREGISVEISVTHTDTVTPNRMAQKIRQSDVDRLSPGEQRALLHLLQATGEKAPETPDEFAEIYRSFITDHYEGDPVDMDRAIITLDPFEVVEGPPNPLNDDDVISELTGE